VDTDWEKLTNPPSRTDQSVSYTPLTKDDCFVSVDEEYTDVEKVLSALNGLKQDDNQAIENIVELIKNLDMGLYTKIAINLAKLKANKSKWFKIGGVTNDNS